MLRIGSKRRRTRAQIEADGLAQQVKEHLAEQLEMQKAELQQ